MFFGNAAGKAQRLRACRCVADPTDLRRQRLIGEHRQQASVGNFDRVERSSVSRTPYDDNVGTDLFGQVDFLGQRREIIFPPR